MKHGDGQHCRVEHHHEVDEELHLVFVEIPVGHLLSQPQGPLLEGFETNHQQNNEDNVEAEEERYEEEVDVLFLEKPQQVDVLSEVLKLAEAVGVPDHGPVAVVGDELQTLYDDEAEVEVIVELSGKGGT